MSNMYSKYSVVQTWVTTKMRRILASISIILVLTTLCGCSGPEGFQDVQNIVSVDYQFESDYYSFDLEKGVFSFTHDADRASPDMIEQSEKYELDQSEIESIKSALEPAKNWAQHYKYSYFSTAMTRYYSYKIVIEYSDGTQCIMDGTSESSGGWQNSRTKWPEGFEELKLLLDDLVESRMKKT